MPQAVAHILTPLLLIDIFRDCTKRGKKLLSRRMVVFGGIAGLMPDLDIPIMMMIELLVGKDLPNMHRTITHSLFMPLTGLIFALIFWKLFRTKKMHIYALLFAFGTFTHIMMDAIFHGTVMPLYPLSYQAVGLDLVKYLVPSHVIDPTLLKNTLMAGLDSALLVGWLVYEEYKKKIKDYI